MKIGASYICIYSKFVYAPCAEYEIWEGGCEKNH